jgi:cell division protein FtsZ
MQGELRVTIVATGLGQATEEAMEKPEIAVPPPVKLVQRASAGGNGESGTRQEQRSTNRQKTGENFANRSDSNLEYLDIPAFLRRRAD